MFMEQRYMIDGFEFCYEEDEKRAKEEFARIKALSSRIDEDDLGALKAVYTKAVEQKIFETQIGLCYLADIRRYLLSKGVLGEKECPIPVLYTRTSVQNQTKRLSEEYASFKQKVKKDAEEKLQKEKQENRRLVHKCRQRNLACVILGIMVAVMFVISMTGNNPTVLNYKRAITDQYAEWEQQLTERENAVRQKEAEFSSQN